jgi:hypothetical protein
MNEITKEAAEKSKWTTKCFEMYRLVKKVSYGLSAGTKLTASCRIGTVSLLV